ncbi:lysoplasmalogenase [Nocardia higoensis]|uniref:lysoplasmalogenase n=1 Tax=Nocardia higoensis TaxID=228599 RepID=UPI000A00FC7F|nr:lysoplasmalogenase [Nocardia higoensis]
MPIALGALAVVTGVHLVARSAAPEGLVADITQVLLMLLLAAALLAGTSRPRGRLVGLVLFALFFSWLGDTVPRFVDGDGGFLSLVGCFLVAQVCYAVAFWPSRKHSLLVRPAAVAIYVAALVVLVVLCRDAGPLLVPVLIYGMALVTMAVLATGLGPMAGVGGAIFLVSDSLIAVRAFAGVELPAHSFWVMLTYVIGQVLLVLAVRSRSVESVAPRGDESGATAASPPDAGR